MIPDVSTLLYVVKTSRRLTRQHGPAIRALRKKDGYEVQEFANMLGISYSHLQNIEHENKQASEEDLNRIARLLGVPLAAVSRDIELGNTRSAA